MNEKKFSLTLDRALFDYIGILLSNTIEDFSIVVGGINYIQIDTIFFQCIRCK